MRLDRKSAATAVAMLATSVIAVCAWASAASAAIAPANLTLHGEQVLHSSAPYLIFWDPTGNAVPRGTRGIMEQYFSDLATDSGRGTNAFAVDRQYTDASGFADYQQTFTSSNGFWDQAFLDTHAYPGLDTTNCDSNSTKTAYPVCLTDAQIQTELTRFIAANDLPTDGSSLGAWPDDAPVYFIVTPSSVNVCQDKTYCSDTAVAHSTPNGGWMSGTCYSHNWTNAENGDIVLYATVPMFFANTGDLSDPQFAGQCQDDGQAFFQSPNGDLAADIGVASLSAAYHEVITNPDTFGGYSDDNTLLDAAQECDHYGPAADPSQGIDPNAWGRQQGLGGDPASGAGYDQTINGDHYYVRAEWSNGDGSCKVSPVGTLSPSFTSNAVHGTTLSFDPDGSTNSHHYALLTWDWGDGASETQNAFGGDDTLLTPSHTYRAPGTYTVTLTMHDTGGNIVSTSRSVTVGQAPTAAFTSSPAVAGATTVFDGSGSSTPNTGAGIASHSWSFGDGSSATGSPVSHVYSSPGNYNVTLTVTDSAGYTSSVARTITVAPAPQSASLAGPGVVHGASVTFTIVCHGVAGQTCPVTGTAFTNRLVGSGSTVIPGGSNRTLTVTLNPQTAALLPKSKGYSLTAKVVFSDPGLPIQTVVFGYSRIFAHVVHLWTGLGNGTTAVRKLVVTGVPQGATVVVLCAGGGCPFRHSGQMHPRSGKITIEGIGKPRATTLSHGLFGTYAYTLPGTLVGGARLAPGARVVLKITAPGWVGEVIVFTTRGGAAPQSISCIPPGARKAQACR